MVNKEPEPAALRVNRVVGFSGEKEIDQSAAAEGNEAETALVRYVQKNQRAMSKLSIG